MSAAGRVTTAALEVGTVVRVELLESGGITSTRRTTGPVAIVRAVSKATPRGYRSSAYVLELETVAGNRYTIVSAPAQTWGLGPVASETWR